MSSFLMLVYFWEVKLSANADVLSDCFFQYMRFILSLKLFTHPQLNWGFCFAKAPKKGETASLCSLSLE